MKHLTLYFLIATMILSPALADTRAGDCELSEAASFIAAAKELLRSVPVPTAVFEVDLHAYWDWRESLMVITPPAAKRWR